MLNDIARESDVDLARYDDPEDFADIVRRSMTVAEADDAESTFRERFDR